MNINKDKYKEIIAELNGKATLVAVSKTKPVLGMSCIYDRVFAIAVGLM